MLTRDTSWVVSLGHVAPDEVRMGSARARPRRGLDEVLHHGRFGAGPA